MTTTKLTPTQVTEATMGDVAFDGVRRRPVVAINDEGQLTICCRRTAAKHGWKVEGTLHQRTRTAKAAAPVAAKKTRRVTDAEGSVVVTKDAVDTLKAVKLVFDDTVENLLK